jgi:hypothetical protein
MAVRFPTSALFRAALAAGAAAMLAACAWLPSTASTSSPPRPKTAHVPSQPRAVVRMLPDRSLEVVTLVSERGGRAHAVRIVPPEHRDYPALAALIADLRPGDAEPVPADTAR